MGPRPTPQPPVPPKDRGADKGRYPKMGTARSGPKSGPASPPVIIVTGGAAVPISGTPKNGNRKWAATSKMTSPNPRAKFQMLAEIIFKN